MFFQEVDSEEYWEKLAKQSDPSNQQKEHLDYNAIIPRLKAKILAFKVQVIMFKSSTVHKSTLLLEDFFLILYGFCC